MLAFTRGEFIFWVAVSVVAGLIVLAIGGLVAWGVRQRGKRQREAAERHLHRAPLHAGLSAVASELKDCAHIAQRCEEGQGYIPELVARLPTQAWADRQGEMIALRDEDKPTWAELEGTYRLLRQSKQSGGYPPKSNDLLALAERLENRMDAETAR